MNVTEQNLEINFNGELDPLRYDGHTAAPQEVARMLADLVPAGSRVLDVGCGTGSVTQIIADTRDAKVIGIEPNPSRAAVARARGLEVHEGQLTTEAIERFHQFDVVMFADVLEHTADPGSLLQLARRALLPGGKVIASVPNVAHWSVRIDLLRGRFNYEPVGIRDATHLRWFTAASVQLLFESNGLRVLSLQQTAGVDLPDYANRRPWRWLSRARRDPIIRRLARQLPLLFGCQHIVHAMPT